ncbi:helix-turn-helix transcriptional regulator [Algoriphagus limi]|uniref:Helix-turn-helix transcriptional regulator n=1 Tax=Algoriphagus limi TaxID=2975273 RepID=A0ABT2G508_9BACT|nr:helix-turn-helix transcriptional regulator [Algoriphagus limi]MCS5490353.1 helix-turn-helix transcriptional regulator [Algoriphagus limi]
MTNRIKEFRVKLGMTQEELAKKVNVRRETIVFLEKNKYNPSLRLAFDLAKTLEISVEDLFSFDDEK